MKVFALDLAHCYINICLNFTLLCTFSFHISFFSKLNNFLKLCRKGNNYTLPCGLDLNIIHRLEHDNVT